MAKSQHSSRAGGHPRRKTPPDEADTVSLGEESPTVPFVDSEPRLQTRLRVRVGDQEHVCGSHQERLRFGRGSDNDLSLGDAFASRYHGTIEHRDGQFHLTDSSTNGTLIARGSARTLHVHEQTVLLEGAGAIHLGRLEGRKLDFSVETLSADGRSWEADQSVAEPLETEDYLFRREGDYWTLAYEGSVLRLKDSKGLRCVARLLAEPNRDFYVLDLVAVGDAPATEDPTAVFGRKIPEHLPNAALGDAGPMLDAQAKSAYRSRLSELKDELEEAERNNDIGRAERASEEMSILTKTLRAAVGIGNKDRPTSSNIERARVMVTTRIKGTLKRLLECHPPLGHHLAHSIKTGRYCSYNPEPRHHTPWVIEP